MSDKPYPELPIIMVDDEEQILISYESALEIGGITNVVCCQDSREAMDLIDRHNAELVMLDLTMPHITGDVLLQKIHDKYPEIPVVIVTGNDVVDMAVDCMRKGAYEYLCKPVSRDRFLTTVRNALNFRELQRENSSLRTRILSEGLKNPESFEGIVTQNETMHAAFRYIEAIAKSSQPVLITGETGVGKELIARAIHQSSEREGELVAVNVAGLDDNVFADTLFGHKKGAFTGADAARPGMIERAAGGTLFLDEIGDMSAPSQVKLLRLLQEKEYLPLGSDVPMQTDARIVVATNQDLNTLKESGTFRNDLYYRLITHHVHIPPLRERQDDIPLLLDLYLEQAAQSMGKKKPTPPKELVPLLQSYNFPGNVRELIAIITDAVSKHESKVLSLDAFKMHIHGNLTHKPAPVINEQETDGSEPDAVFGDKLPLLKDVKKLLIREALRRTGGNKTQAAELLGTSRQALNWHIKQEDNEN